MTEPSDNLQVTGLPLDCSEETVRSIFCQYGIVTECKVLPNPGRPDRTALVRMGSTAEAKWLVTNLHMNIPLGLGTPVNIFYAAPPKAQPVSVPPPGPTSRAFVPSDPDCFQGSTVPGPVPFPLAPGNPQGVPPVGADAPVSSLQRGTVKNWNEDRGFGFIVPDAGGADVFCHIQELGVGQMLVPGSSVLYEADLEAATGRLRARTCLGAVPRPQNVGILPETTSAVVAPSLPSFGEASSVPPSGYVPGAAGGGYAPNDNLFITGLPSDATEQSVWQIFAQYGGVHQVKVIHNDRTDRAALVRMNSVREAQLLVDQLHLNVPLGLVSPVTIRFAENRAQKSKEAREGVSLAPQNGAYGKAWDSPSGQHRAEPYDQPVSTPPVPIQQPPLPIAMGQGMQQQLPPPPPPAVYPDINAPVPELGVALIDVTNIRTGEGVPFAEALAAARQATAAMASSCGGGGSLGAPPQTIPPPPPKPHRPGVSTIVEGADCGIPFAEQLNTVAPPQMVEGGVPFVDSLHAVAPSHMFEGRLMPVEHVPS
eukprot:TRINITY_DN9784_c0_g1_i1.p1 TRINITY_DN9784_c0_g1~~TRINITY_DN9784_c0_g1_i1.p1  ORF type:complete len:538 (+),score=82.62 TRINITY_DN9784_c0_g1_i1:119-1732(+)